MLLGLPRAFWLLPFLALAGCEGGGSQRAMTPGDAGGAAAEAAIEAAAAPGTGMGSVDPGAPLDSQGATGAAMSGGAQPSGPPAGSGQSPVSGQSAASGPSSASGSSSASEPSSVILSGAKDPAQTSRQPGSADDATGPTPSAEPAASGTEASDILARAESAYAAIHSMQADFVQQVYVPLLETTVNSRGTMYHRAPDRFLMDFSDPEGDIVVADGTYVWMYYPSNDPKQVMRGRLAEGGRQVDFQREFLSDASERFAATLTGTESVGGRPTHALTLVPRGASPYSQIRIWVDTKDYLVRRFEITEANGSTRKLELSNLRPNVPVADSLFDFTPPPGTQVIEP